MQRGFQKLVSLFNTLLLHNTLLCLLHYPTLVDCDRFARKTSSPGASLVMKLFDGGDTKRLIADCKAVYETVKHVRPEASRKESSELFIVCRNFKGENVSTEPELIGVSTNESSVTVNS